MVKHDVPAMTSFMVEELELQPLIGDSGQWIDDQVKLFGPLATEAPPLAGPVPNRDFFAIGQ